MLVKMQCMLAHVFNQIENLNQTFFYLIIQGRQLKVVLLGHKMEQSEMRTKQDAVRAYFDA